MKKQYYWCFRCERAFHYEPNLKKLPEKCPNCQSEGDFLDWQSYTFGLGSTGNYPVIPEDGEWYPVDPIQ